MTTEAAGEAVSPKPSFKRQLKLEDFAFKSGGSQATPRRSPRLSTPLSTPPSTALSAPSKSVGASRKRKALASSLAGPTEEGDDLYTPSSAAAVSSPARKQKRGRPPSGYAPPSTYAHLSHLPDAMGPNLLVLFVGLNPGVQTAQTGHAYAHPSNLFWRLLFSSRVTPVACRAAEDRTMPARFALGLTNIVSRPSRNGGELRKDELDDGVAVLEEKARRWRPEAVCLVGKGIWESVWRVRHGGRAITKAQFRYGWQDKAENMGVLRAGADPADVAEGVTAEPGWKGARVFVATSTSGLAASLSSAEKETIWRELGAWVEQRREERAEAEKHTRGQG